MKSTKLTNEVGKFYQFTNCRLLRNHQIVKEDLWVQNGIIMNPANIFFDSKVISDVVIDCKDCYIFPGLIDLQINGAFGYDFSYDAGKIEEAIEKVSQGLVQYGVTSFCPTIISSPCGVYDQVLSKVLKREGDHNGAGVLGLHLEGPFISSSHNGAHPLHHLYPITSSNGVQIIQQMSENAHKIAIVTLAPEIDGGMGLVEKMVEKGVVISMGHSSADMGMGKEAVCKGARFITHLFNAMLPFHHRDPHLIGLLVSEGGGALHYGVIADGIHTHPAALSIAYNTCPKGMVLVTDAVSALGLNDGTYRLGGREIEVVGNRAVVAGTDVLCGSLTPLNKCVKFLHDNVCKDIVASIEAATLQPATVLGIQATKGTLAYDSHADVVMMDGVLNPLCTMLMGRVGWLKEGFELECVYR